MSVFDKIRLSFRENLSAQAEDLQTLREQVLTIVLRIIALFGVFLVVTNAMVVIQDEDWGLLTFFIIAYAGILICTFVPKIPFSYRASSTVLIPLGLSITDIMDFGLTGDGMV
ncbi:MAG: hypothetical protein HUU38_31390, partial [Anaerolineales bacterium]|nr:hypothetical protein [Anaerolineales bacterium]